MSAPLVIVDHNTHQDPARLRAIAEAITVWCTRDVGAAPPDGWDTPAVVRVAASLDDVQPGEAAIGLFSHPDVADALGYHDKTPAGTPLARVFPMLEDDPEQLPVTIAHEAGELLVDPECCDESTGDDGVTRARELCDAVEATSYGVQVSSGATVLVSNFVLPTWFSGGGSRWDHMGLLTAPYQLLPGGYIGVLDPRTGQWTQQVNGQKRSYRAALERLGIGRHRRRVMRPTRGSYR